MVASVDRLEADYRGVNIKEYEDKHADEINVIRKTIQEVKGLHGKMEKIFGKPGMEFENTLDMPQGLGDYGESIRELLNILMKFSRYPEPIHHLQIAQKNCILETINYIRRYKLATAEDLERLQREFSSEAGLEWISNAIVSVFRTETEIWNTHLHLPLDEEKLKHSLHMVPIYDVYKGLGKSQQDFVLFGLLIEEHGVQTIDEFWKESPATRPFPKATMEQIPLLLKMRKYLARQLHTGRADKAARDAFFYEARDDLMRMMALYFRPGYVDEHYSRDEFLSIFSLRTSTLKFITERIGSDYVRRIGRKESDEGSAGFGVRYQWHQLFHDSIRWKEMLLYLVEHASKFMGKDHEVSADVLGDIGTVYLNKIRGNFEAHKALISGLDRKKLDEMMNLNFYKSMIHNHQHVIESLPQLERNLKALGIHPKEAGGNL
ncbi:hypothetical protein PtA15_13A217 [Puccinia triticina]|uniref:Exocyst complex component Sec8 n=1 Tax=Puccinia triticina TaxID=208348 RepID=A0ABY7CZS1_9BASI|nr:uncharacterized protein PtA15_13A217 [Puccinia triticina]WAQ90818.1 hypothetical protein PtA15_13A217 [Puccinia triticina]